MADYTWTIDGTVVDRIEGPTPTVTRGSTQTLSVIFDDRSTETTAFDERYRTLREYIDYANGPTVRTFLTDEGIPKYRERIPSTAPVTTFLVDVEPGADVIDARGFWAVLVGGQDVTVPVEGLRRLELELYVLAELADYADKAAVKTDLGSEVV